MKRQILISHICVMLEQLKQKLLFLNDDIEIIGQDYEDTDWLSVLVGQAKQESTGAVGAKLLYRTHHISSMWV